MVLIAHAFTLFNLYSIYVGYKPHLNKYADVGAFLIPGFIAVLVFNEKRYNLSKERWADEEDRKHLDRGLFVSIYVIASIVTPFVLINYLPEAKGTN